MDNLDDSENNAKISDSAYSTSCSNSQSRRSHSSKSTHSGSHSSGSSGYGGKPSTSGSSNILGQPPKKDKESKKKKQSQSETLVLDANIVTETRPPEPNNIFVAPKEEPRNVVEIASPAHTPSDMGAENMDIASSDRSSTKDEIVTGALPLVSTANNITTGRAIPYYTDGFSCVISMHDGVVMYTTPTLTAILGFPVEMWIGRSFIDFVHPKDRNTFASQITSGLAVPKIVNGTKEKDAPPSTMVCRIRRFRGLTSGFGVKDKVILFTPFLLKLSFKNINDEEGKFIYLVLQATPFFSAYINSNEIVTKAIPFVLRHAANGIIEYVDPESVRYLGYLPQELIEQDALQLYHPEDLSYLSHVYETIVKEGGFPRCKPYRMMTQNGDYVKLETEWSSFINPWSKKLEFIIGKHHVVEGPTNPDVFISAETDKNVSDDVKKNAETLRETIVRIMNEVLTKPEEVAKQQMSKRCQDLATFMESLMEDQPKADEELRLDIQDPDNTYFERDSVMLGGISPHHDYTDSKSGTGTPLSYTQLNYNETLQRYFGSHRPNSYEDYNTVNGENILGLTELRPVINVASSQCLSPIAQTSGDSCELNSSCGSNVHGNCKSMGYQSLRLTELLLTKHNVEMEKELKKCHRENRSGNKGEREKAFNDTRLKKQEHLARCNASFQPTTVCITSIIEQPHGVKRAMNNTEEMVAPKQHCPASPRQTRRQQKTLVTSAANEQPSTTVTTTLAATNWSSHNIGNVNTFIMGVGVTQQIPFVGPVAAIPGLIPMYYTPAIGQPIGQPMATSAHIPMPAANPVQLHPQPSSVPWVMYGQPFCGSPFVYPSVNPQTMGNPYPVQQTLMAQSMQYTNTLNPLSLTNRNYEEACRASLSFMPELVDKALSDKKRAKVQAKIKRDSRRSADNKSTMKAPTRDVAPECSDSETKKSVPSDIKSSSNNCSPKVTEVVQNTLKPETVETVNRPANNEEIPDKTDGESSYSSFYSSFFKTESGSAEDSGDVKKGQANQNPGAANPVNASDVYVKPSLDKIVPKRKMEPPWMEQVSVTSELFYKYQVHTKKMEDVLAEDRKKIARLQQPSLVNEQLGQLYLDLQLEGVAARLTLEESVTSSSSSAEEVSAKAGMGAHRKREYSKLVMIYEEDAPLPSPSVCSKEETGSNS